MTFLVFQSTNWQLNESLELLLTNVAHWVLFTLPGAPDINRLSPTFSITSGVFWTLPYEWVFYMSLPLLAIATGQRPKFYTLLASILFLIAFGSLKTENFSFLGGIIAAILAQSSKLRAFARKTSSSFLILILFGVVIALLRRLEFIPYAEIPLACIFVLIAAGNSMFGALKMNISRAMGEYTYGIYLLHGLILYITFKILIPSHYLNNWSLAEYWAVIAALTPVVIGVSAISFVYIELPAIRRTRQISNWLKASK
jgi:peptidoglycan/LPS O-acetylase OafA/YrhL